MGKIDILSYPVLGGKAVQFHSWYDIGQVSGLVHQQIRIICEHGTSGTSWLATDSDEEDFQGKVRKVLNWHNGKHRCQCGDYVIEGMKEWGE